MRNFFLGVLTGIALLVLGACATGVNNEFSAAESNSPANPAKTTTVYLDDGTQLRCFIIENNAGNASTGMMDCKWPADPVVVSTPEPTFTN